VPSSVARSAPKMMRLAVANSKATRAAVIPD
jgi:hypothetical protein